MKQILIADDAEFFRVMYEGFLSAHAIQTFRDPRMLLEAIEEGNHPELVITDYEMPEMKGDQLAQALRSAGYAAPILMITGREDLEKPEFVTCLLRKPVRKAQLNCKVNELLRV